MDKEYLIHEKPLKALSVFAFPMIVGNLFQQFYTMVDSMVVGRYVGESALAAVGASYSLTNVFICIAIGGGVGASVITSRYFGSRSYQKMKQSAYLALTAFLVISIILAGAGLVFGRQIMQLLNTPAEVLDMATDFLNIYFIGLPFLFMYNVLAAMFNAIGKSRIPLYLLIFSSVLNIILDICFVRYLHWGVPGAAWATLIAQGVSAVISFIWFLHILSDNKEKKISVSPKTELKEIFRIALPSILQQSTVAIGMMLVQSVVNGFGTEVLAGFSAAMRVESICIVPMAAIGNAISSYTAQNLGARKFERVREGCSEGNKMTAFFAIIIFILLKLFYTDIIASFLGDNGTALALSTGVDYLKFMSWFFILIGLKMVTDGVLRGAGDMKMFTVANLANLGFRVCFAVIMAPRFGIAMVWYAVPVGWLINFVISYIQYSTGKWRGVSPD